MKSDDGTGSGGSQQRSLHAQSAATRRNEELRALAREGMPIVFESKWKSRIGPLHIWPHSGRWWNKATGMHGKINSDSMRVLIRNMR